MNIGSIPVSASILLPMPSSLPFEKSIIAIEDQIAELRKSAALNDLNVKSLLTKLQSKVDRMLKRTYEHLSAWDIVQVARLPERPKFGEYVQNVFEEFVELSGDRLVGEDCAIVGGFAKFDGKKCVLIGQEKGSDTNSRLKHNFGMAKPEGYRKALRLFDLAERFRLPIITLVDTSGAYPGIESEERGQAEAIARCIEKSFNISVPMLSIIIGEGGSGGAIALASCDHVLMLEYSIYSVISPEGCASILWKDETKANIAAELQHITSRQLKELELIDEIIKEPIGGAHRNKQQMFSEVFRVLNNYWGTFDSIPASERKAMRRQKFQLLGEQFVEESK